jgi:flagellar protein FlaG
MTIQSIAALTAPSLPGDAAASNRNLAQSVENQQAKPVATQTKQAASQVKQTSESAETTPLTESNIQKHLSKINEFLQARNSDVQFTVDKDTGMRVVKVVDHSTKEVIRQFPTEEAIKIAKALDSLQGLLIRQKA